MREDQKAWLEESTSKRSNGPERERGREAYVSHGKHGPVEEQKHASYEEKPSCSLYVSSLRVRRVRLEGLHTAGAEGDSDF